MGSIRRVLLRLRALVRLDAAEREADRELASHVAMLEEQFLHQGLSPDAAHRAARSAFGGVEQAKELHRAARTYPWLRDITRDIRYAFRTLRRSPGFAVTVVATLALGIGANATVFSVVNSLVLRSLPVSHPERLAVLDGGLGSGSFATWTEIQRHAEYFDGHAAWSNVRFTLGGQDDEPELVQGLYVSGDYFTTLGVTPAVGRVLTPGDDERGVPRGAVAVVSYGLWQRRFGGATDVVGVRRAVEGVPFTVVGVTPETFLGMEVGRGFDVAVPIGSEPLIRGRDTRLDRRNSEWLTVLLRLKPGQSIEAATAALRGVQPQIRAGAMPEMWPPEWQARFLPTPFTLSPAGTGTSSLRNRYHLRLITLLAVVALLLLIASVNVASLLLARTASRRHETGVRLALGAPRVRIARRWLVESLVLSALGATVGLMLAAGSGTLLIGLLSTSIQPVRLDLSLDWRVLGFTGVVAVVTALIFGTAPAVRAAGTDPIRALGEGHRHGPSADAGRQYAVGLALSHAMCLILVLAAGLFVRTFATLATVPLGFEPDSLLVATVETSRAGVQPTARPRLFQELVERAKSVPGVAAAAASSITPVGGNSLIDVVNRPNEAPTDELFEGPGRPSTRASLVNYVTPGWFGAYGIPVRAGRDIAGADTAATPAVAVVNQAFVDRFYPGSNPLGARFSGLTGVQKTIVGIVSDAVYESPKDGPRPTIYMPLAQFDWANSSNSSVAITVQAASGPPMHLARSLSAAFSDVNSALLVAYRPMADQVQAAIIPERAMAMLSALFGGLALLLASIGLYGVTSHGVAMRRRELGIRMALGASGSAVVGLMLRRHLRVTGLGVVLGLTGAAFGARYVDSMLFGITPLDPGTWLGVSGLMMVVALVATYLPARRARRSDPLAVLRAE